MAGRGYTVQRVPARSYGGVHYTYTNVIMCNDLVLVPTYTNSGASPMNATALAAWATALPAKTIVPIGCQAIVSAAGVMHCIAMHVPAHLGGTYPTAWVRTPSGGEILYPGTQVSIAWNSDDDVGVSSVDLFLSTDGGQSYPITLATGLPRLGPWTWTVPDLPTTHARLRVVATDADSNTGQDESDGDFVIVGTGLGAALLTYGQGKPGALGTPLLTSPAAPLIPSLWTLAAAPLQPQSPGFLVVGLAPAAIPADGALLLVDPLEVLPLSSDALGNWSVSLGIPDLPAFAGSSLFFQVWMPGDPGASGLGWTCSAGLEARIGY
jgi:hypothetical protein